MQTKWAVYRAEKITSKTVFPMREILISVHADLSEAMDEANKLAQSERSKSFLVGEAI